MLSSFSGLSLVNLLSVTFMYYSAINWLVCVAFAAQVRRSDVLSAWSGLRPLAVDPRAKDTASASRDHVVVVDPDGLITVTGARLLNYFSSVSRAAVSGSSAPGVRCGVWVALAVRHWAVVPAARVRLAGACPCNTRATLAVWHGAAVPDVSVCLA